MLSIIGMFEQMDVTTRSWNLLEGAHNLDIDERLVLCNLLLLKRGYFQDWNRWSQMRKLEYVESRGRKAENLFKSDDDAATEKVYDIN